MSDGRPLLFVTNHVPPERRGAFAALHEREGLELALFGGRSHHATAGVEDPGVPHRRIAQRDVFALAASGRYRAVVCGTAGRVALPAAWRGARRAGVPFVLWSALWHHPRTPAHLLAGAPLLLALYRDADAVVVYGPHVGDFVLARGARNVHVAPQAVDNAFWSAPAAARPELRRAGFVALHVGRPAAYKGVPILLQAWREGAFAGAGATLVLAGAPVDDGAPTGSATAPQGPQHGPGVVATGHVPAAGVRNLHASADVLVMPALATRQMREPWGLVANEAMNRGLPVIATDAVGAAAGGLVRHERNGLVVPAGDAGALARALRRLRDDAPLRRRLGEAARRDVAAYTFAAWAAGFSAALRDATESRTRGADA